MSGSTIIERVRRYRSQLLAGAIWIATGISVNLYMRLNDLTVIEFADQIGHLLKDFWYGPILYILLYFVRPLSFFPGTPITMLAGYVYGVQWGFIYAMVAGLISTSLPYITGRWFSDESQLKKRLSQSNTRSMSFVRMMRDNPFQTILTTRFLYLPYDLVNFVAGSLHIPLVPFVLATLLGNVINVFIMVSIGASIEASLAEGRFVVDPRLVLFSLVIWLVSLSINRYLKSKNKETRSL